MPKDRSGVPKMIKWELPSGDKTLEYSFGLMHKEREKISNKRRIKNILNDKVLSRISLILADYVRAIGLNQIL